MTLLTANCRLFIAVSTFLPVANNAVSSANIAVGHSITFRNVSRVQQVSIEV